MSFELRNNERFRLSTEGVLCFEEYERAVETEDLEHVANCQNNCLDIISTLLDYEYNYFPSLILIHENLLEQIKLIGDCSDQMIFKEITVLPSQTANPSVASSSQVQPVLSSPVYNKADLKIQNVDNKTDKYKNIIKNTLVIPRSKGFSDLAGLTATKNLLEEAVILPYKYPHLFTGDLKKLNKTLLYGPSGTGKTLLSQALAAEVNAPLYCVSNSDLLSCYVGESEKLIKTLFKYCEEQKEQCIIFFDEIDSFCRKRSSNDSELGRRLKNQLLIQLSELDGSSNDKIFFLASTNYPWDLDPAFLRRFQRRIYVPLPDSITRFELLNKKTENSNKYINDSDWNKIVADTEGYSSSDLSDLVNFALMQPIRDLKTTTHWKKTDFGFYVPALTISNSIKADLKDIPNDKVMPRSLIYSDFRIALKNVKSTVTKDTLTQYEEFNNTYG